MPAANGMSTPPPPAYLFTYPVQCANRSHPWVRPKKPRRLRQCGGQKRQSTFGAATGTCVAHSSTSQKGGNARFERETLFQQSMTLQPIQTPFELLSRTEVPQSVRASERACAVARLAPYQRGRENATCLYNVVFFAFRTYECEYIYASRRGPDGGGAFAPFCF